MKSPEELGREIGEVVVQEIKMAFAAEAGTAMGQGKSFEEWFNSEDPHARFRRLLIASSAPRWLVKRWTSVEMKQDHEA